jgi:arylsulfatase A-like enzyme/thioredoxin-like negative regulator of GroEL
MEVRRRRTWLAAGVVIAALVAIAAVAVIRLAPTASQMTLDEFAGANVLLVTLDTTRADRIGCYGYAGAETPVLDGLAADGVLFERCITPTGYTLPSHSSIMTGFYPPFHGVRLNGGAALADVHMTLAETLNDRGYRSGAFIAAFVLDQRWGLGQGFERYDDDFDLADDQRLDLAGVQRPANLVVDAALEWLEEGSDQPFFAWVHLYDPHIPYDPPEPFRSHFSHGGKNSLYDGEIAFTDSQVGRLLEWLDVRGVADDTIVVVVGDHGEGLGDHGEDEHGYFVYDYAVRVPFLVRLPGTELTGVRVRPVVRTIDVAPTVLELLGLESTEQVHGVSLVGLMADPDERGPGYAYSESMAVSLQYGWSALYSVRTADYKFIEAPRSELYDLREDPDESDNLFSAQTGVADELRAVLADIRSEIEQGAPETQQANLDEETLSMLAALGYVGGATTAREGENLADPKDKIHLYEAVGFAANALKEESFDEAARVLEIVLADDPAIPQARLQLAAAYRKLDRTGDAKTVLDEFLREDPDNILALIGMAAILSEEGNDDEVLAICRRALSVDDHNVEAYELMAGVYAARNDHAGALPLLRTAVDIQPKLTRNRNDLAASLVGLGRFDEAEPMLLEIVAEYPEFPLVNFNLGLLYEEQGRIVEASEAYEAELENHPESVVARFNLGNLLLRTGDPAGAAEQMQTLIDEASEEPRPYLLLARIQLANGEDLAEVERLARGGLERAEAAELKALGYYLLADVYSRQGRQAELQRALEQAQRYRAQIE